jgi:hypothetical protein
MIQGNMRAMSKEQHHRLSKFGWFTVSVLILIGGVRVGSGIRSAVLSYQLDKPSRQAAFMDSCESFFGDGEDDRPNGRIQSQDADPPVPSIVPIGKSRCWTLVNKSLRLGEDVLILDVLLSIVGVLLGVATLSVSFLVLKRSAHVSRVMTIIFIVQLIASAGQIAKTGFQQAQIKELLQALWPGIDTAFEGWIFVNGETLLITSMYAILCLAYFELLSMVRSKKMWIEKSIDTIPETE